MIDEDVRWEVWRDGCKVGDFDRRNMATDYYKRQIKSHPESLVSIVRFWEDHEIECQRIPVP